MVDVNSHIKVGRRKAIKSIGAGIGVLGGIATVTPTVVADEVNETHEASTTSESSGGKAVDAGTCVTEYKARADSGGGEDYWVIKFEAVTNAQGRDTETDERWDGVQQSRSHLSSSTEKWRFRAHDDNKYWIGGGEWDNDKDDDDYSHAEEAGEAAVGLIPYVGTTVSAIDMIAHLWLWATDYKENDIYDRNWNWGPSHEPKPSTKQGEIYNRWECDLDPGQRAGCTLEDGASAVHNGEVYSAMNELIINFNAPYSSSSNFESMSSSQLERKGVDVVPAPYVKKNPFKYGETPRYAAQLDEDDIVYYAPIESEVTVR